LRVLLVASAFNSLTQRVHTELRYRGHEVAVELALGDDLLRARVAAFRPDLIVAPMLTTAVPEDIWTEHTVLIVHPGPKGDRGPSSLDWAISEGASEWGVTVLQAVEEMDAGPIWASVPFPVPACGKSELYRNEMSDAAVAAVLLAVERFAAGDFVPEPLDYDRPDVRGRLRPYHSQQYRRIDWTTDSTAEVLRKLRAADSQPGVLDELYGREYFVHGGHNEDQLRGEPGAVIATRDGAICRATVDGAVWLPQLRRRRTPGGHSAPTCPPPLRRCRCRRPRRPSAIPGRRCATARKGRWATSNSPTRVGR
jgi:putative two-component system hydrogenase maturation factor HypX/HoxX